MIKKRSSEILDVKNFPSPKLGATPLLCGPKKDCPTYLEVVLQGSKGTKHSREKVAFCCKYYATEILILNPII